MRSRFGLTLLLCAASCNLFFHEAPSSKNDAAIDAPPPTGWVSVSAGIEHTCAIDNQGSLWCWGSNRFGQLGQPLATRNLLPTKVNNESWTMVSGRGLHTCAIRSDKTLWCWGANPNGQLGINSTATDGIPQRVTDKLFTFVDTSRANTCAVDDASHLYCWGENASKQIGDPQQVGDAKAPVTVDPQATWRTVAVGDSHVCGLHTDQTLWCWGSNRLGQLDGIAANTQVSAPLAIATDTDWAALTTFAATTCGVKNNGTASCWGANSNGEFGNGMAATTGSRTVAAGGRPDWSSIVLGAEHTCGIKRDTLDWWCWGNNGYGQLGQFSSLPQARSPVKMATDADRRWLSVALGARHSCAIDDKQELFCMGGDSDGQLGIRLPVRSPQSLGATWSAFSVSGQTACGLLGPDAKCWGNGRQFQMGNNVAASLQTPQTVTFINGMQAKAIAAGNRGACASVAGNTYCWGSENNGEFGNGTAVQVLQTPTFATTLQFDNLQITSHTCGVAGGITFCWGANGNGQTRQSVGADVTSPQGLANYSKVVVGGNHSCGLNNNVWKCWGDNGVGQLGNPADAATLVTVDVSNLTSGSSLVALSAGLVHTCGIANTGAAWCWGLNLRGELGDNTTSTQQRPVAVQGGLLWQQLALGALHTCGVATDAKLYCWGDNSVGQLGGFDARFSRVPVQVGVDSDWASVDAGDFFTCAQKNDKSLWCWGFNNEGQVGVGTGWRAHLDEVPLPK